MSGQLESEEGLFEAEPAAQPVRVVQRTPKRHSAGPVLPVRMSSEGHTSSGAEDTPQGTKTGTSGKGRAPASVLAGTVLGAGRNLNGLELNIGNEDGTVTTYNIWRDVIRGTNAKTLHRFVVSVSKTNEFDARSFIENISYQGFNREYYIMHALKTLSLSVFVRYALVGAIRGSNFTKIMDTCEEMPNDLIAVFQSGRIVKKPKKKTDLTILRFTASVPQWCAYWMHAADVEKKISGEDCPAYIQFPAAASLPMSSDLRRQHIRFSMSFSKLLPGGSFNENIYITAYTNMVPLAEVPDALRMTLGVNTMADAKAMTSEAILKYIQELRV